jgi:hypothetical protein
MIQAASLDEDSIGVGEGVEGLAKIAEIKANRAAEESNKRKFVPASNQIQSKGIQESEDPAIKKRAVNTDEINIDDVQEDEDIGIQQKSIPAAVFGSVAITADSNHEVSEKPRLGALGRFSASH